MMPAISLSEAEKPCHVSQAVLASPEAEEAERLRQKGVLDCSLNGTKR